MKYISTLVQKIKNIFTLTIIPFSKKHKIIAGVIAIALLWGGYTGAKAIFSAPKETQYMLSRAVKGDIQKTIAGTGQVAATNQIDIQAKVSGDIVSVSAKAGQAMKAGEVIARIDTTDIALSLQSARLSLQKLQVSNQSSAVQSSNSLVNAEQAKITAEADVLKSYEDAKISLATAYIDIPDVAASLNDMFYGEAGFLNDRNSAIYNGNSKTYRDDAGVLFDTAERLLENTQNTFRGNTGTTDPDKIEAMLDETYTVASKLADALKKTKIAVDSAKSNLTTSQNTTAANTAQTNVSSWSSKINSRLNDLLSTKTAIRTAKANVESAARTIAERKTTSTDELDLQSQQLNVRQKEIEYAKYTIRAPFDGVLASLNIKKGDSSSGTIGTFITKQKIAEITLNEIDAANVIVGQSVELTFDALDGVIATGTVANIDLVGTVTQGVVNYTAQIAFDIEDERIKPGMSVSATITTENKKDILVVPSAAVKTQGNRSYVEVAEFTAPAFNRNTSSTSRATTSTSSPRIMQMQSAVSLPTLPSRVFVEVGITNNTLTEIISGITEGQFVVTKTVSGSSTLAAPAGGSLFNAGGANRGSGATMRSIPR